MANLCTALLLETQFQGQVLKELEVDVPMIYLSDSSSFTIGEMISNILESYGLLPNIQ
jgi:hypothetical protein